MSNTKTFVDIEGPLRDYLRTLSPLTALVGQRIFLGVPTGGTSFPFITMARIGGGPQANLTPLDDAVMSFSCWGAKKEYAGELSAALVTAIENIPAGTEIAEDLICGGASVTLWLWSPDTSTDKPTARYLVDGRFTFKAV